MVLYRRLPIKVFHFCQLLTVPQLLLHKLHHNLISTTTSWATLGAVPTPSNLPMLHPSFRQTTDQLTPHRQGVAGWMTCNTTSNATPRNWTKGSRATTDGRNCGCIAIYDQLIRHRIIYPPPTVFPIFFPIANIKTINKIQFRSLVSVGVRGRICPKRVKFSKGQKLCQKGKIIKSSLIKQAKCRLG